MMRDVEEMLGSRAERVLLVETSGLPAFEHTWDFYAKLGYDDDALIRDYYQAGGDKIVFP